MNYFLPLLKNDLLAFEIGVYFQIKSLNVIHLTQMKLIIDFLI